MGGDGGVKATQRAFIRGTTASNLDRSDALNIKEQRVRRSKYCAQSGNLLQAPIVSCELGNLFNKDDLINALLNKQLNQAHSHIRGLKDIKTLVLYANPAYDAKEGNAMFACPVTQCEFNGHHPFVASWSTGVVLSDKALKELGPEALGDYGPFTEDDCIHLLPSEEELGVLMQRMINRREDAAKEKKASKKRQHAEDVEGASSKKKTGPSLTKASAMVSSAQEAVKKQAESSAVYKKLFHKDKETDKGNNDLFMTVAGFRYSVL